MDNLSLETTEGETTSQNLEPKRMSKAQKRRNKKEEAARQRQEEIAQQEIQNESGARNVEFVKLRDMLKQRGQQIYEIPSDGNCLYNAVAHQINQGRGQADYKQLRQQAAKYMRGEYCRYQELSLMVVDIRIAVISADYRYLMIYQEWFQKSEVICDNFEYTRVISVDCRYQDKSVMIIGIKNVANGDIRFVYIDINIFF